MPEKKSYPEGGRGNSSILSSVLLLYIQISYRHSLFYKNTFRVGWLVWDEEGGGGEKFIRFGINFVS